MAPSQTTMGAVQAGAPASATSRSRTPIVAALIAWGVLGAAIFGIIVFGGFDGRPVDDLSIANPLRHHTYFGPAFLAWLALSALGVPRALQVISRRD